MTLAEMNAEVYRRIEEETSAPVFWTSADVDAALNDTYIEFCDLTECHTSAVTVSGLSHRTYYDLRNLLATTEEPLVVDAVYNATTYRWLIPASAFDLDTAVYPRWESVTGEPDTYFVRGLWWLGIYPQLASDTGTFTVIAATVPARLTASDSPTFEADYHNALVEGALYELLCQDREVTKGLAHYDIFVTMAAEYSALRKRRTNVDRLGVIGGL